MLFVMQMSGIYYLAKFPPEGVLTEDVPLLVMNSFLVY